MAILNNTLKQSLLDVAEYLELDVAPYVAEAVLVTLITEKLQALRYKKQNADAYENRHRAGYSSI